MPNARNEAKSTIKFNRFLTTKRIELGME